VFTPSEAEIWLLQAGKKRAISTKRFTPLRRAVGLNGESHYWLAKSLLSMNRLDAALALIHDAFEDGSLPKDYSICYPKLLLLGRYRNR